MAPLTPVHRRPATAQSPAAEQTNLGNSSASPCRNNFQQQQQHAHRVSFSQKHGKNLSFQPKKLSLMARAAGLLGIIVLVWLPYQHTMMVRLGGGTAMVGVGVSVGSTLHGDGAGQQRWNPAAARAGWVVESEYQQKAEIGRSLEKSHSSMGLLDSDVDGDGAGLLRESAHVNSATDLNGLSDNEHDLGDNAAASVGVINEAIGGDSSDPDHGMIGAVNEDIAGDTFGQEQESIEQVDPVMIQQDPLALKMSQNMFKVLKSDNNEGPPSLGELIQEPQGGGQAVVVAQDPLVAQQNVIGAGNFVADEKGLSACLLIKDDNNRLIEWLAYHYHVLPLRHLVVAVDPDSVTSPEPILKRWDNEEMLMDIHMWDDHDYMNKTHLRHREERKGELMDEYGSAFRLKVGTEGWLEYRKLHRDRQNAFVSACCLHHKKENRTWVALIDADEYIVYNKVHEDDPIVYRKKNGKVTNKQKKNWAKNRLPSVGDKTVMEYLQDEAESRPWAEQPCVGMIRQFFGAIEANPVELAASGDIGRFQAKSFDTLRFFRHDKKGVRSFNGWGKIFVDVSRIKAYHMRHWRIRSIHNPFPAWCPQNYSSPEDYFESLLRVHHYLGSWEAYNARSDIRRNRAIFEEKAGVSLGPNYDIQPWLESFVKTVGIERAERVLQGVGEAGNWKSTKDESCALLLFGVTPSNVEVVLPSIQANLLKVNPNCDVFVHSYNMTNPNDEYGSSRSLRPEDVSSLSNRTFVEVEPDLQYQEEHNLTFYKNYFSQVLESNEFDDVEDVIRQWHAIERAWIKMSSHEKERGSKYLRVGLFRADVVYAEPVYIVDGDAVVVPSTVHLNAGGDSINNGVFYGLRRYSEIWITDRFGSVGSYLEWRKENGYSGDGGLVGEDFVKYLMMEKWKLSLAVKDICFHQIDASGTIASDDCNPKGDSKARTIGTVREPSPGIIVLGMHRSGTSMLAGLLVRVLSYVAPGKLLKGNSQNPNGFFENWHVVRQNDVWLADQGKTWRDVGMQVEGDHVVGQFDPESACAPSESDADCDFEFGRAALEVFNNGINRPWVMKDPRLCLTLPSWIKLLDGPAPAVIFTYRNPLHVANSLNKRRVNTVESIATGLQLWIWYNIEAIRHSRGLCRIVTSNEDIIRNATNELNRINDELLRCGLPPQTVDEELIDKFVKKDFQHGSKNPFSDNSTSQGACIIPHFESQLDSKRESAKEEKAYMQAMQLYCDMQSRRAFSDDYEWPASSQQIE